MHIYMIFQICIISLLVIAKTPAMAPTILAPQDYPYESDGYVTSAERSRAPSPSHTMHHDGQANMACLIAIENPEAHDLSRDPSLESSEGLNVAHLINKLTLEELNQAKSDALNDNWKKIRTLTEYYLQVKLGARIKTKVSVHIKNSATITTPVDALEIEKSCKNIPEFDAYREYVENILEVTEAHQAKENRLDIRIEVLPLEHSKSGPYNRMKYE